MTIERPAPEQEEALYRWVVGQRYRTINRGLRTGKLTPLDARTVAGLDSLMRPLPRTTTLYRQQPSLPRPGETVEVAGYLSTTDEHPGDAGHIYGSKVVTLTVPAGYPVLAIDDTILRQGEGEVILARGAHYRVGSDPTHATVLAHGQARRRAYHHHPAHPVSHPIDRKHRRRA